MQSIGFLLAATKGESRAASGFRALCEALATVRFRARETQFGVASDLARSEALRSARQRVVREVEQARRSLCGSDTSANLAAADATRVAQSEPDKARLAEFIRRAEVTRAFRAVLLATLETPEGVEYYAGASDTIPPLVRAASYVGLDGQERTATPLDSAAFIVSGAWVA